MTASAPRSFGVFKPVGHVVVSLPDAASADHAADALTAAGLGGSGLRRYTDLEMLQQIDADLAQASPVASIGQEVNLVRAHQALAERGYHWLVVPAADDAEAARIAEAVKPHGAARAQHYGRFIIEELLERPGGLTQVAESPDRGLDAQTASGEEADLADPPAAATPPRG